MRCRTEANTESHLLQVTGGLDCCLVLLLDLTEVVSETLSNESSSSDDESDNRFSLSFMLITLELPCLVLVWLSNSLLYLKLTPHATHGKLLTPGPPAIG